MINQNIKRIRNRNIIAPENMNFTPNPKHIAKYLNIFNLNIINTDGKKSSFFAMSIR